MDFPIAPDIARAIPDPSLEESVRMAFARRAAARHQLVVDPDLVMVLSDVVQAIYLCLLAFTQPGEGVVFLTPAYPPFFSAVQETGRAPITFELTRGTSRFEVDLDRLRERVTTHRARLLLLCNPHNPTGRSFDRAELQGILEIAERFDLVVVSDEIHADLTLRGAAHLPFAALGDQAKARSVTLSSASKAFNLAGLRCAVAAFGSAALLERFSRYPAHARGSVSVLGMVAARAAWTMADAWLEGVLSTLSDHRDLVTSATWEHLGRSAMHAPQATYLAWLDLRSCQLPAEPAEWLRDQARVALSPGPDFGPSGSGHVRLNFATPRPLLLELLDRVWSALEGRQ
jgi:cystathionine beta-lyase